MALRSLKPGRSGDIAVFTAQIASLAGSWVCRIARWHLAANIGIQVRQSCSAVAIRRDWLIVDMVHWGHARLAIAITL